MKKLIIGLFGLLAASTSFAQQLLCTNGTPGTGTTAGVYNVNASSFVVRGFPVRCSTNVSVTSRENAVAFVVGGISRKGKSRFLGSTGGGAINAAGCAAVTCVDNDADTDLATTLASAT